MPYDDYDDYDDAPLDQDLTEDDEDADTSPCPNCRRQVYEEADQCPYCGYWITASERGRGGFGAKRIVFAAVAVLLVIIILTWSC